jgi:hypothetical protein
MNRRLKSSFKTCDKKHHKLERSRAKPERSERRKFKKDRKERMLVKHDRYQKKSRQDNSKTKGIEDSEIERRNSARECLRCTWPADRKRNHRVKDCIRPIKLDKGTASYPKAKEYQKMKIDGLESDSEEDSSYSEDNESSDCRSEEEESSESEHKESEGEYLDEAAEEQRKEEEERNWWDSPSDSN